MECIRQTNEVKMESRAVKTSRLAERVCGLEGTLALKNFKRNKKRYRSIVMSLGFPALLAFFFYFTKNLEIGNKI